MKIIKRTYLNAARPSDEELHTEADTGSVIIELSNGTRFYVSEDQAGWLHIMARQGVLVRPLVSNVIEVSQT